MERTQRLYPGLVSLTLSLSHSLTLSLSHTHSISSLHVQDALKADGIKDAQKTAALLCGVKGMTEGVKEVLKDAGVPDSNVLFNF